MRPIGAGLGAKADAVAQAAIQSMILMFNVEQSQWWWPPGEEKERRQTIFVCGRMMERGQGESMEEAEARRQKLQALKERAKRARDGGADAEDAPKLKFRNYQVHLCAHVSSASSRVCRSAHVCAACMPPRLLCAGARLHAAHTCAVRGAPPRPASVVRCGYERPAHVRELATAQG